MTSRKTIIRGVALTAFIAGAVLLGIGSAGTAAPIIIAGIVLVMASGASSLMASMEHPSSRPIARRSNAATAATV